MRAGDRHVRFTLVVIVALLLAASIAQAQRVTREDVPGIANLARIETTVACAGAVSSEAVPKIKTMGFVSIINLREDNEPGANVGMELKAALSSQ